MIFKERQRLDAIWPISLVAIVVVCNYIYYFVFHNTDMDIFFNTFGIALIGAGLLSILKLDFIITNYDIRFKFFPFHFKWQIIPWLDILSVHLRNYNALTEFYGRGIKSSLISGKAYSISGNEGLQIILKNGKKILLGTHKTEELKKFLLAINK
ncbi:MAG: hypothetical protein IPO92_03980 [Saprospiraceae bacterium]|nr:hypothetical protein [Saprospiraceae bacterium]